MPFDISREKYTDVWITPKYITDALGEFDLDPCSNVTMPWQHAKAFYTIGDNGLEKDWFGRVWLNPPYSKADKFLEKMVQHGNGIVFLYTRVETKMFFKYVWGVADAIFFFKGRKRCTDETGEYLSNMPPQSQCLIAYGGTNSEALVNCGIGGYYIDLKHGKRIGE